MEFVEITVYKLGPHSYVNANEWIISEFDNSIYDSRSSIR